MEKKYPKLSLNSISVKLIFLILMTVVPIVCLAIYNNNQSRTVLLDQVNSSRKNMLQTYVDQIDNQLNTALSYVINMVTYETDPQVIAIRIDNNAPQYAKVRLSSDMSEKLLVNNYMDGYFVRVDDSADQTTLINSVNWQHPTTANDVMAAFIQQQIDNGYPRARWQLCTIDGSPSLVVMADSSDNIWAGAYVSLSSLLSHLSTDDVAGSRLQFIDAGAMDGFERSLPADTQCVSVRLASADMLLTETFPQSEILGALPFMQKYTLLISVVVIVLFGILITCIRTIVSKPLMNLSNAMKEIQAGNLDFRIQETRASSEIQLVNTTFNRMVGEIQNLRIGIYEEQLKVQKSQLHNLQMQIKPHFLINSLNMVYNLIETAQLPLACRLIQFSIDYFRYMVKVDKDLVPLNEEIDHVKAYLNIQSIRYKDHFSYDIQVESFISDMQVPPVMLQTFVENAIKYALSFVDQLHINIHVSSFEKNYFPYAKIIISDNGGGYPEDFLDKLNSGEKIIKKDGTHTGIRNTVQRLQILFGPKASYRFYNDGGAVTEVILPATFPEDAADEG